IVVDGGDVVTPTLEATLPATEGVLLPTVTPTDLLTPLEPTSTATSGEEAENTPLPLLPTVTPTPLITPTVDAITPDATVVAGNIATITPTVIIDVTATEEATVAGTP